MHMYMFKHVCALFLLNLCESCAPLHASENLKLQPVHNQNNSAQLHADAHTNLSSSQCDPCDAQLPPSKSLKPDTSTLSLLP